MYYNFWNIKKNKPSGHGAKAFFPLQVTLFNWFTILFFIHKSAIPFTIEPIFTPLLGLLLHTTLLFQWFHCTPSVLNQLAFELWNQMPHALLHQHYHTVFSFNPTPTTSQTKHIQNSTFFHIILPFSNTTHQSKIIIYPYLWDKTPPGFLLSKI